MDEVEFAVVGYRNMSWASARLRKPTICAESGEALPVGSQAYRPLSNGLARMERISPAVMRVLVEAGEARGLRFSNPPTS